MDFLKHAGVSVLLWLFLIAGSVELYAQADTSAYALDTVKVVGKRYSSALRGNVNETLHWNMEMLHDLPKILGNADPMHYTQLLPGVQTCSEYTSGLYVQGCDNAHNLVSIEEVPLYNANHLLGLFSVFNASHFSQMHFSKTAYNSGVSNYLGGILSMQLPDSCPSRLNGEYAVGPMSSQGTLRIPLGGKSALFLSLRAAYLNLLYQKWLRTDNNQMEYDFADGSITYLYVPDSSDKVKVDFYAGYDDVGLGVKSYRASLGLKWANWKFSTCWEHQWRSGYKLRQTVYVTHYHNRFSLEEGRMDFRLPSSISDVGYKGVLQRKGIQAGGTFVFHHVQPQSPNLTGTYNVMDQSQARQKAWECALFADYDKRLSELWTLQAGMRMTVFRNGGANFASADPMLAATCVLPGQERIILSMRMQHQYLFQTGFSSLGLPTSFWFPASGRFRPQYSHGFSLAYDVPLANGAFHLYAEGYYKRLYNQVEYKGSLLDFLNSVYTLEGSLLSGKGENYGINVMLNKRTGRLTGWISYAWGRALRRFREEEFVKSYPASHERTHELNAVATYQWGKHVSVGATMVFATGTPYTAPEYIYFLGNRIVAHYGEYNANRLKPYFRLDCSLNYSFFKENGKEAGLNLSLYNTTCTSNELFNHLSLSTSKTYAYKPVSFFVKVLPSINFYHKF